MPTRKYSDAEAATALSNALQGLPDNYLECRDMRHAWKVTQNFHVVESRGARPIKVQRTIACVRCESERIEYYQPGLQNRLVKVSQHIKYAPGYLLHDVPRGNKPQSLVQGEQFRRVMSQMAEEHTAQAG